MSENVNTRLVIDPVTRTITPKYRNQKAVYVAKGDHNSVLIYFEMPRYVDGYDMSAEENAIQIHYANMDGKDERKVSKGFSDAITVTAEKDEVTSEDVVSFCWLIPKTATRYAGVVSIGITFERYDNVDGKAQEVYSWSTAPYGKTIVWDRLDNSAEVVEREYNYLVDTCNAIVASAMENKISEVEQIIDKKISNANNEIDKAIDQKITDANSVIDSKIVESEEQALLSKSYAVGGTDIRVGEDADNSRFYYEQTILEREATQDSAVQAYLSAAQAKEYAISVAESKEQIQESVTEAQSIYNNTYHIYTDGIMPADSSARTSMLEAEKYAKEANENAEFVKDAVKGINKDFSNALKGNATAVNALRVDGVSPIEHEMSVRVRSKNIIPFPYERDEGVYYNIGQEYTTNGLTYTVNEDGSITINGTTTKVANIYIVRNTPLSADTYAISCQISGTYYNASGAANVGITLLARKNNITWLRHNAEVTGNAEKDDICDYVTIYFASGVTCENVVVSDIQLAISPDATVPPYTPFVDVSEVKVKRYSRNIFDIDKGLNKCLVKNEDGTYTITKYSNSERFSASIPFDFPTNKVDVTDKVFVFSMYAEIVDTNMDSLKGVSLIFYGKDKTQSFTGSLKESYGSYTTSSFERVNSVLVFIGNEQADGAYITFKNPQIAIAYYPDYVLDYEPFVEPIECTVNADGTVNGLTSISPTTTLITDNGVVIEVEYNRDINDAFKKQQAQIDELKAMILNLT